MTLACVSNKVGGDLVGNAYWRGVPLPTLLREAGIQADSTQVIGRSLDGFTVGFPTDVALDGRESMVVLGMNGEPLPAEHGFPGTPDCAGALWICLRHESGSVRSSCRGSTPSTPIGCNEAGLSRARSSYSRVSTSRVPEPRSRLATCESRASPGAAEGRNGVQVRPKARGGAQPSEGGWPRRRTE